MLRSSAVAAALLALTCSPLCFAQDKPADPQPLPNAKPINLQLEASSPEEAFAELAKQAGVQIKPMQPGGGIWAKADPVELKVENGHFWPVFIDMCQQANVRFNPMYNMGEAKTVQVFGSEFGMESITKGPYVEVQGCIIALTSANRSYSVSFANPKQVGSNFGIQAMFLADPGLELSGSLQGVVSEAVDENGTSFVQPNNQPGYYGRQGGSLAQNLYLNLAYPANAGKKLARLKGEVKTTVTTKSETISIDSPTEAEPLKKDVGSMAVEIKSVKAAGSMIEVQLAIQSKRPMRGMEHQNMWSLMQAIELTDAQGNRFSPMGGGQTGGSANGINATMRYGNQNPGQPMGKPAKLTWVLPVETKEVSLPFEFKDLPIP